MGAFRWAPSGVGDVIKVGVVLRCVTELSQLATSHRFCSGSAGRPPMWVLTPAEWDDRPDLDGPELLAG